MYVCMHIYVHYFGYLLIQVGRKRAEQGISASYRTQLRTFLEGHGGFFGEELARLANDEAHKKDNNINGNKPEAPSTEQQQKSIAETYADEDKGRKVDYQDPHQSNGHQIHNVIEAVKSKGMEREHHVEEMFNQGLDVTIEDQSEQSGDDSAILENLHNSFAESGTNGLVMSLSY